nr:ribose-5-phosphate isomerase B [uncultured bacterium]
MKIAIASDHAGISAKARIVAEVTSLGHEVTDFGPFTKECCDYPDYAAKVARAVSNSEVDQAILIGGTGIGMSIVANKFRGVRAALCHDEFSAQISRRQNDANILCLASETLCEEVMAQMIFHWLNTPFEAGRHQRRITKIMELENELAKVGGKRIDGAAAGFHS